MWTAILTLALGAPGCDCGGTTGNAPDYPCTGDAGECPAGTVCDPGQGLCVPPHGCNPPDVGCPCIANQPTIPCSSVSTDPVLADSCRIGEASCVNGRYGECALAPDLTCTGVGVGAGSFNPGPDNSSQVVTGPEGELILDPEVEQVDFGFLWVANTGENTVSKLDIETGREVARYASVRGSAALGVPAVPLGGYNGDAQNCGNCPSRTAIDFHGNAFVANRAFGEQATVTKFGNDASTDCVDRDGNGAIATSSDVNGDGIIQVDDPQEFLGEGDECILWTKPVGNPNGVARALAIDAGGPDGEDGNVWVGLYAEHRVVVLGGNTGDPVLDGAGQPISVALTDPMGSMSPYGAAVDGGGNLWVTGLDDGDTTYLAAVNTFTAQLIGFYAIPEDDEGISQGYGITVDTAQRVWLGGYQAKNLKAFDQATGNFHAIDIDNQSTTRGVAADLAGNVYVAFTSGKVGKYPVADILAGSNPPGTIYTLPPLPGGAVNNTIGVGIDRNGACWAVSRNDDQPTGQATRIEPSGAMQSFPVGRNPYTYSDFTGFGMSTVVRPNGWWRGIVEGCAASNALSDWKTLNWSEYQPVGTSVKMRLRVANTLPELASATWYGAWDDPPVDLDAAGVPDSRYMEVEVQMSTADPDVTPAFNGFNVDFTCPGTVVP